MSVFADVGLGEKWVLGSRELEGNPPSELTVHISNTWSVKSPPIVILLGKKKIHSSFGKCKNSFTSCIPI